LENSAKEGESPVFWVVLILVRHSLKTNPEVLVGVMLWRSDKVWRTITVCQTIVFKNKGLLVSTLIAKSIARERWKELFKRLKRSWNL